MSDNIRFHYLYRDAGNFKVYHAVTFANPDALQLDEIECRFRNACDSGELFIAHQIHLPELFLEIDGRITANDHCFHQFDYLECTSEEPDDEQERSISVFLEEAEREAQPWWEAFDIIERIHFST